MANADQNPNQTSLPRSLPPPTNSPSFSMTTHSGILSQTPSVKLDSENYLLWQNMLLPILRGYNLEGLILGTMPCPSATTTVVSTGGTTTTLPNPEYELWMSKDQLVLGWLYNSIQPKVASRVMGHKTSMSLWEAIKNYFGKPVESSDLITQVLAGLDEEYTPIVVQLTSKDPITWEELQSTLMTYESRMEQLNAARLSLAAANTSQASANFANRSSSPSTGNRSQYYNQNRQFSGPTRSSNNNRGGYRARGRGGRNPSQKPIS
ncbi:hypothetical protein UlMin_006205 [Ulmus minor]